MNVSINCNDPICYIPTNSQTSRYNPLVLVWSRNNYDLTLKVADLLPPRQITQGNHLEYLGVSMDISQGCNGEVLYLRFPIRPRVWGGKVGPAGNDNFKEAEFPEPLNGSYAIEGSEPPGLYRL